jgi:hypothetical protein
VMRSKIVGLASGGNHYEAREIDPEVGTPKISSENIFALHRAQAREPRARHQAQPADDWQSLGDVATRIVARLAGGRRE